MTDRQVYERALAEMQRCQERIEELRAFVRVYEEFAGHAVRKRVGKPDLPTAQKIVSSEMQDWERMAVEAIRRAGRPLRVRDIYEAIVSMGYRIHSERPVDVLGTRIGRSLHFRKADRGLYTVDQVPELAEEQAGSPAEGDEDEDDTVARRERESANPQERPWEQAAKGAGGE